jgi:hypothetical protein
MYLKCVGPTGTLKVFRRADSILLAALLFYDFLQFTHPQCGAPLGSSWVPVSFVVEELEPVDPVGVVEPEGSRPIPVFIQFESKFHTELKELPFDAVAATRARCDSIS